MRRSVKLTPAVETVEPRLLLSATPLPTPIPGYPTEHVPVPTLPPWAPVDVPNGN